MDRELKNYEFVIGGRKCFTILEKRTPWLLYHRVTHQESATFFNQNIQTLPEAETNMIIPQTVGFPQIFSAEELRLYPGSSEADQVEAWVSFDFEVSVSPVRDFLAIQKKGHLEVPLVDDDGIGPNYNKLFSGFSDHVNGGRLPMKSLDLSRTYEGSDPISVAISIKGKVPDPVRTYAVLIGSLWIPSQKALEKASRK
jgi:hypothetical protein